MMARYKVKICGTTNRDDALMAANAGADYFGAVIETAFSPRSLAIDEAASLFAEPPIPAVALVFQMEADRINILIRELAPFAVQFLSPADPVLLGRLKEDHPNVDIWQSLHLPPAGETVDREIFQKSVQAYVKVGVDALVFDTAVLQKDLMKFGGTGVTSDWALVKELMALVPKTIPVWLAGGIRPENVTEALDGVDPYGIDLCSGVEAFPGKKDLAKIQLLMERVRSRDNTIG